MSNATTEAKLPQGFKSPFLRVAQEGSHDDLLACVATLTGKTLVDVRKTANMLGLKANGPFWVTDNMVQKLLWNLSDLMVGDWVECEPKQKLPDVVILCVDFDAETEVGRHVIVHSIKEAPGMPAFSYVIDPANWIEPQRHITTDLSGLNLKPSWYREVSKRPGTGKAKGK